LSASLINCLIQEQVQTGRYYALYCAMAKANWLQTDKTVKNPYYGESMLKCGEIRKVF
jgi:Cu(I)/Ag(I) efflux system membrane fusion protein